MPHPRPTLTIDQASDFAATGFAGEEEDLVGIEVEWPLHHAEGAPTRPAMAELSPLLSLPLPHRGSVTVEPGGQIELSTTALPTATSAIAALDADAQVLHARLREHGLCPVDLALDDRRPPERILDQPRYVAMEAFFAHRGCAGTQMMTNTASVQINISHDPRGGHERWKLANRIGPLLIAAFANSPGIGHDGRHWQSRRQEIWSRIDPGRTAPLPLTSSPERDWARYALAADVFFINTGREGIALPPGLSFGEWIAHGHPVGWPTQADLRYHLTTLFPPIRPRGWLELRMLDALPPEARAAAVHAVCAAMSPTVAPELMARLPDTRDLWSTAARAGLTHPTLRAAALIWLDTAEGFLQQSPPHDAAAELVGAFADRYTRRGVAPAHDPPDHPAADGSDRAALAATL
jgi:glutamate--cysteine ligase